MSARTMILATLVSGSCGNDKSPPAPPSSSPQPFTPGETIPAYREPGRPLAPKSISDDMVMIPRGEAQFDFYLDITEVTVRDYDDCVKHGRCKEPSTAPPCDGLVNNYANRRSMHPVNCITEVQAWRYCRYRDKRLPTTAEFRLASSMEKIDHYPWGTAAPTCTRAVLAGCGPAGTSPVGSKPEGRSPQGVLDLVGNVAEISGPDWTLPFDLFNGDPQKYINANGGGYATRGNAAYFGFYDRVPDPTVGFRCASDLPGEPQRGAQ